MPKGKRMHALLADAGYPYKAVCGAQLQTRHRWTQDRSAVTCPRCLAKLVEWELAYG